jgi:hypothetical protein
MYKLYRVVSPYRVESIAQIFYCSKIYIERNIFLQCTNCILLYIYTENILFCKYLYSLEIYIERDILFLLHRVYFYISIPRREYCANILLFENIYRERYSFAIYILYRSVSIYRFGMLCWLLSTVYYVVYYLLCCLLSTMCYLLCCLLCAMLLSAMLPTMCYCLSTIFYLLCCCLSTMLLSTMLSICYVVVYLLCCLLSTMLLLSIYYAI